MISLVCTLKMYIYKGSFITYRIGSFGKIIDGKYIEILRIDNGTFTGFKGPNNSHFHLNGNKEHIFDINRWPWKR